ncbi:MAG: hypothetical protein JWM25_1839 [Thermoleophilia bacterium]|nr:hypothetical protein [Thermoleophilia bacterium]MCZ4497254.1 hypothetical protein [Thermoleophilia bacterium]
MSEFTKELIPVAVMFGFVLMLIPVIVYAMWQAIAGDRMREENARLAVAAMAMRVEAQPANARVGTPMQPTSALNSAPASDWSAEAIPSLEVVM